jgi:uracil-DNA glycosylase family 4
VWSFFDTEEPQQRAKSTGSKKQLPVELLHKQGCNVCPLNKAQLISPKMEPTGASQKKCVVYILGEAPGADEDQNGEQFVGKSGQLLRSNLPRAWSSRIRWNNTIRCRPPNNRDPHPVEVECCRPLQHNDIEASKPLVIIGAGNVPLSWTIPGANSIMLWRGRLVPVKIGKHVCWYYPIIHPSAILRTGANGRKYKHENHVEFERDLRSLFDLLDEEALPDPVYVDSGYDDGIDVLLDGSEKGFAKLKRKLREYEREKVIAFDYETTGFDPYFSDSRILTTAVASKRLGTFAFPLDYPDFWHTRELHERVQKMFKRFLRRSGTKVCHNAKFEQEWTGKMFGERVLRKSKWGDTQALAYILDSRKGGLSLDVLTRMHFGFWLKELCPINYDKILQEPLDKLLKYNALDSKWTLALYQALRSNVRHAGDDQLDVYRLLMRSSTTLAISQIRGIPLDTNEAAKLERTYTRKVARIERRFKKSRGCKRFVKRYGKQPSLTSTDDMGALFKDVLKISEVVRDDGSVTTADDVLSHLDRENHPEAHMLLQYRSLTTVLSTFIVNVPKQNLFPDGKLHTDYNHLLTATMRLSSSNPNLQNFPKRKYKEVRRMVRAPEGKRLVAADYGQIEARIIAMASEDKNFVKALWTGYDVHGYWAKRAVETDPLCLYRLGIVRLPEGKSRKWGVGKCREEAQSKDVMKRLRDHMKNGWVFPLFFGSSLKSAAGNIHIHVEDAGGMYDEFWAEYSGVRKWQRAQLSFYEKHGYSRSLIGFRRYGPLGYNEIINNPIQSTAAAFIHEANNRLSESGMQSVMNIHDDLSFLLDAYDGEPGYDTEVLQIARTMCGLDYDFINVPLVVEVTSGPSWYEQNDIGKYVSTDFQEAA